MNKDKADLLNIESDKLVIELGFLPLLFFLYACRPVVEINGKKYQKLWGRHHFKLPPGKYKIKIYFPYLLMAECGTNDITIDIQDGVKREIYYYMSKPWIFAKGSIKLI